MACAFEYLRKFKLIFDNNLGWKSGGKEAAIARKNISKKSLASIPLKYSSVTYSTPTLPWTGVQFNATLYRKPFQVEVQIHYQHCTARIRILNKMLNLCILGSLGEI